MAQSLLAAAGGLFVILWIFAAGTLIVSRTALPPPVRFLSGSIAVSLVAFAVLTAGAGYLAVWLLLGAATITAAVIRLRLIPSVWLPGMNIWFRTLFAGYGAIYLIYLFAPEIQPDAITYHLGLVSEYVRTRALTDRVGFYELLPQGVDMLFVPAFAIGAHVAAKFVHFAFLIATVSLIRHIAREFSISDTKACSAAAIFLMAPVVGVASTSAYTDMALVCCCCSVLWLAARWRQEPKPALLLLAGLDAGFCYAIKPTFAWVTVVGCVFFAWRSKRLVTPARFAAAAAVGSLLWMIRATVLSGSPFAPFLNNWFPTEASTRRLESILTGMYSAFRPEFHWTHAPLDYTILGGNQGLFGPAFLLIPVALLTIRTKPGRWLVACALLLSVPALANTGARFLMPAAAVGVLAFVSALPTPAAVALVVIQAIGSSIAVIDRYDTRGDWRLSGIPIRAAFGLEAPRNYMRAHIPEFGNDEIINSSTPAHARIFALGTVHQAYLRREVLVYWQSAQADRMVSGLEDARVLPRNGQQNRRAATAAVRRAGYHYILVSAGQGILWPIGKDLLEHGSEWGVIPAARSDDVWLFYISPTDAAQGLAQPRPSVP